MVTYNGRIPRGGCYRFDGAKLVGGYFLAGGPSGCVSAANGGYPPERVSCGVATQFAHGETDWAPGLSYGLDTDR